MNKQKQIQTAYRLWEQLLEMERILLDHYNDEFLALVKKDPSRLPPETTIDDLIPF